MPFVYKYRYQGDIEDTHQYVNNFHSYIA